jgi:hypothetical protein
MFLERMKKNNKTPKNSTEVTDMLDLYLNIEKQQHEKENDPLWQKNNLEYDLRTTDWILSKVRNSDTYAQNLYAALCNNEFIKNEVFPILKEEVWSCSWRYAGGIIADMQQKGDYINWYCSGIVDFPKTDDEILNMPVNVPVPEGLITTEIRSDLLQLGWIVVNEDENI